MKPWQGLGCDHVSIFAHEQQEVEHRLSKQSSAFVRMPTKRKSILMTSYERPVWLVARLARCSYINTSTASKWTTALWHEYWFLQLQFHCLALSQEGHAFTQPIKCCHLLANLCVRPILYWFLCCGFEKCFMWVNTSLPEEIILIWLIFHIIVSVCYILFTFVVGLNVLGGHSQTVFFYLAITGE